ncbi:MAG: ABC transporter substrate-binding protein [Synergistales bacterium]|nr:ABC transporter substrate-binding protein [Synergistales bacterium]
MKVKTMFPAVAALMLWAAAVPAAEPVTVMLEWYPNVDHLPLYVAREEGFFADEGLEVEILNPSDTSSSFRLAVAGRVDVAVTYETQVLRSLAEGVRSTVVGTLIDEPLNTLLYLKGNGIEEPADLRGRTLGFTEPTIGRMWELALEQAGVADYEAVNIQFAVVPSLVSGRVAGVMGGYRNYEYVELKRKGYEPAFFTLPECGFPHFAELVLATAPGTARERAGAVAGFRRALERAAAFIDAHPDGAMEDFFAAVPEADRELERAVFAETKALYPGSQELDAAAWQRYADFLAEGGLLSRSVDVVPVLWKGDE